MKNYIKGMVIIGMAFGLSAIGEEAVREDSKDFSVRISLGSAPGVDEVEFDGGDTVALSDEGGGRLEVLAVKRFWGKNESKVGGTFGGGLFFGGNSGKDNVGDTVDLSVFGVMIQGGVAVKAGDRVVLEFGPYLGVGIAENEVTGFSSGTGAYGLFGVKGGVFVLLGERFELGLELGYEGFAQSQEFDDGFGGTIDSTWSGGGVRGALVAVIKF